MEDVMRYLLRSARIAALAFFGAVAAAGSAPAQSVLKYVPHADLRNLDPIWTTAGITLMHGYMVYDTLFALDANLQPKPQMVETYSTSPDGLKWTFTLRDGLKWHDGTPVTAADCVASINRWGKRDVAGRTLLSFTDSIVAQNEKTFVINLKRPYGLVLESLGKPSGSAPFMMREKDAMTDPFQQVAEVVGSGPFRFMREQWVPGSKVVYVKNQDYVPRKDAASGYAGGKTVKVDRVEWMYLPDHNTAAQALMAGEIDFYEAPPITLLPILKKAPGIKTVVTDLSGRQGYARFNHLVPPFNNPKARQALLLARDQKSYLAAMIGDADYEKECYAYFVCGTPHETDVAAAPYKTRNLDKAKQLLKESGYNGEKVVVIDPVDVDIIHNMTLVTVQNLRDIGINVEVQAMDWSTLTSRRPIKDDPRTNPAGWNIFHTWSTGLELWSPVTNFAMASACDQSGWFGWSCNSDIEKLRDDFLWASEGAARKKVIEDLQVKAYDHVPYVPTGQFFTASAYRANITGLLENTTFPAAWNIEKK
jgi:peptide/nickel transport system substrate-binding protein